MEKEFPLTSVIVLNYNGERFLGDCLKSVLDTDYPNFEVIVVDNNSKDCSLKVIKGVKPLFEARRVPLVVVKNSENLGFAEGNNVGARFARGKYIVFLNNDTLVERDWLGELVKILDNDSQVGAAQSKILSLGNNNLIDCAGGFLNPFGLAIERGFMEKDRGQYDKIDDIFYAKGTAAIFRRELFNFFGGFDPDYFLYHEEVDLCWRIRLGGYRIVFVPRSVIYHIGGVFAKKAHSFVVFNHEKNRVCTLIKNYSFCNLIRYLSLLVFLEILQMISFIFVRKPEKAKAIFNALIWNFLNLKTILRKRRVVQDIFRKVPDRNILRVMRKAGLLYALRRFKLFRVE